MQAVLAAPDEVGLDQVRLTATMFVPEIQLHLAEDAIILWARLEAEAGHGLPPPYWASAWVGGQAVARYVLDNPETVAGRRVLDLAAGCGLAGIAAAMAGAASVEANDIDAYAHWFIRLNAGVNGVSVVVTGTDLLDGDGGDAEVVLVGDAFYTKELAERAHRFVERVAARGVRVFVGDPARPFLPRHRLVTLATYQVPTTAGVEHAEIKQTYVLQPRVQRMARTEGVSGGAAPT